MPSRVIAGTVTTHRQVAVSTSALTNDSDMPSEAPRYGRLAGLVVFAILVVALIHRETLGIQLAGLFEICLGLHVVRKQEVPYGWRGRAPSGYIRGIPAIAVGLAVIGLGIYVLLNPETVAAWGRRH